MWPSRASWLGRVIMVVILLIALPAQHRAVGNAQSSWPAVGALGQVDRSVADGSSAAEMQVSTIYHVVPGV